MSESDVPKNTADTINQLSGLYHVSVRIFVNCIWHQSPVRSVILRTDMQRAESVVAH